MTRINLTRTALFILLLLASGATLAQGFMRNISASGLVIDDGDLVIGQIACTVVDQGTIGVIIFAEATDANTDPLVALVALQGGEQVFLAENDDWVTLPTADRNAIVNFLRAPNGDLDSALIGTLDPGSYCAFAFQVGSAPAGSVNLQITDVSEQFTNKNSGALKAFTPSNSTKAEALIERSQLSR